MKVYKVYEIEDNDIYAIEKGDCLMHFVGAFESRASAQKECEAIDVQFCNSANIVYDEITEQDIEDMLQYGITGFDKVGNDCMLSALKQYRPDIYEKKSSQNRDDNCKNS